MLETPTTPEQTAKQPRRAKIAIIGGGSLYCADLLNSLAQQAEAFRGCHITLMDINKDRLNLIHTIGTKLFQHAATDITLEKTTNQKTALLGADIVLTTFRTGGMQARLQDEKIPLRHGLMGQETVGAGGFFYALRTVPIIANIALEMEKIAPQAFLLNYTDPSNIITEAVAHCSGIRVIGMCDGPLHEVQHFAQQAGIDASPGKHLSSRTIGLNHGNWTTVVWRNGINVVSPIITWAEQYAQQAMTSENYQQVMLATLIAQYKAIPSHYMHYYYFPDRVLAFLQQKSTSCAEDILATLPDILAHYREEAQKDVPNLTKTYGNGEFSNLVLGILRSILNDTGEEWVLNMPNNGSINFFANDRVVELSCRVDARGAMPLNQGDGGISIDQRGLLCLLAEYQGATAQAALWGTRRDAIRALAANPLVLSYSKAEAVYNDLAAAHAQYLPERLK